MRSELEALEIMSKPGVYFVRLSGEALISVNNADAIRRDLSVHVNCTNCKYGSSVNLRARYAAYRRTFGAERLRFQVLAFEQNPARIERLLHAHFASFRMLGRTGRATEWLSGICPDQAFADAQKICGSGWAASAHEVGTINRDDSADDRSAVVTPEHLSPADVVSAAEYLQLNGMSEELLAELHHFPRQSYAQTLNYFRRRSSMRGSNMAYAKRLEFVVRGHQRGSCFADLVGDAKVIYPLTVAP
ncbi:GIY-YIG nuclease family protein [Paracoccus sp. NSM]|uniref:GIY-YIG nuclease family protein n=1 Tax=Paracoccus sp. NSM TaxID=3457784 RepID=UPI004035D9F7